MLDRRAFFGLAAAAALVPRRLRAEPVRFGIALPVGAVDAPGLDGVSFGFEEAQHTWSLLGREIIAGTATPDDEAVAIVNLADVAPVHPLVVDVRARYACDASVDAFRVGVAGGDGLLWLPDLERYGAAQLNQRFRDRFGRGMDEHAWAGWFGAKVVTEAVLRARSTDADALALWLLSDRARFDGHKGQSLRFDAHRRLVQPTYRVTDDGAIALPAGHGACAPSTP